ncbi:alpha-amylase family glycosyl hydrolase [Agathobacter rectalis]|uniref:Glycosidase n=1 Tax=Agathobacter rectalis TaxID=39491 RepID=A0A412PZX3_9FIRM|nr:alpha-amylase family glycosyl hydrolase [Agathobacter rectalis]RGT73290.1 glycosidase [Agathobacter rectalis]RGT78080.1 glycosidase [Agathobacter rectalis]
MRKLKERFHRKHGIVSRIFSMVLALAMIVTMVPAIGGATTAYAASPTIRLYLDKPSTWNTPVVNVWATGATVDNHDAGNATITQWGNQEKPKLAYEDSTKLYYVDVQSSEWTGFQFVDAGSDEKAAPEIKTEGAAIEQIKTFTSDTSIYCLLDDNGKYQWYKDASKKETLIPESVPTECDLTINYKSTLGDDVAAYIYKETNKPAGEWPGKTMTATAGHEGWYTMHLTLDNSTDYSLILNDDGHGNQLKDVTLSTKGKAEAEYWFDGSLSETKPADWKYVTTIHYLASGMGSTIYNHMWGADASATGAGVGKEWPGGQISENADHSGWYDVVYTQDVKQNFSCIFNNNNGTQTDNIDVSVTSTSTELWVTGTKAGGDTTVYKTAPDSWEAPVPDHTFTIYYYNEDLSTDTDLGKVDMWMWNAGLNGSYVFDGTYYDAENDVTWFKKTITVAGSNVEKTVGLKARYDITQGWDGGSDTADRSFTISGDENEVLYYVDGSDPVHEKPVIKQTEKRYLVLDYENPGLKEKGITPQFYTWTSGYASVLTNFTYAGGDKWTVTIPAKPSCTKVDFCIALDSTGDPWIKDGGDHSVTFPSDQKVIYASMKAGSEPEIAMPYNTGYEVDAEKQQVSYYYRDDAAFVDGTLKDMTVSVDVNGTEYPMTYNDTTKRFEYVKSGLTDGKTHYRYKANGTYAVDAFNSNSEKYNNADYSYFEYYKLNATVTAEVMNKSFSYNENDVVKFKVEQDSSDAKTLEVASASIDVSSLGGSNAMPIEPELQAVTISATTDTTLGIKTLPITVTDQYGNKFSTTVDVEITDRVKENKKDFDWDEAVVYFMMTDRFFDGNESNNTASGADTYGDNPGLYHGGDFAGVTAKLDYLQNLGVNTIWITPIVENIKGVAVTDEGSKDVPYNAAYHGYWASDFTKLNPTLGTTEEFETMISEAHSRGMRIMVDIVVNHAGYGTESTFADMLRDKSVSEGDIKSWQSGLPDFATENADVRAKLVEWQTSWMKDYGVDYFRVDTVKHVDSTTWAALKNSTTEVNPSFKMIGEYYGAGYAANGNTLGSGQMDADLDFDFNDQATSFVSGNISSVEKFLSARNSALNNTYMTGQFLSSHDEDGFKAALMKGKEYTEDEATSAALVAATLQLTAKGIPVIYYGEEVGLSGLNNYPYQTNRYDMDFSLATEDNVTYQHYKNLLSIRNAYTDVFTRGSRTVVASSDEEGYDVVSRSYGGTTLYVGMNIKDAAKEVKVPVNANAGDTVKNLYDGKTYTVSSDKTVTVSIPAAKDGGTVILTEVKKTVDPTPADPGKKDPTPTPAKKDGVISVTDKAAIETKKAAPKSGDDNEAATYVCLLGLAMVAITAATYRKKRACK